MLDYLVGEKEQGPGSGLKKKEEERGRTDNMSQQFTVYLHFIQGSILTTVLYPSATIELNKSWFRPAHLTPVNTATS